MRRPTKSDRSIELPRSTIDSQRRPRCGEVGNEAGIITRAPSPSHDAPAQIKREFLPAYHRTTDSANSGDYARTVVVPAIGPSRSRRQPQIGRAADFSGVCVRMSKQGREEGWSQARHSYGDRPRPAEEPSRGKPQSPTTSTHTSSSLAFIRRRAFCRVKAGEPVTHAAPFTLLAFSEANDGELVQIGPVRRRSCFYEKQRAPETGYEPLPPHEPVVPLLNTHLSARKSRPQAGRTFARDARRRRYMDSRYGCRA